MLLFQDINATILRKLKKYIFRASTNWEEKWQTASGDADMWQTGKTCPDRTVGTLVYFKCVQLIQGEQGKKNFRINCVLMTYFLSFIY